MNLTYVIGDIHGRHDLLQILLQKIWDHAEERPHRLVFLGDYIDRGPDSAAVVETVRTLQAKAPNETICLKGNHEAMLLAAMEKPALTHWWIGNGGDAVLASYRVTSPREIPADVLDWLRTLPTSHEDGQRYYVHAGLRPGVRFQDQTEEDKIWIREPFLDTDHDFGKHVVHGHTPLPSARPDIRPFRTNLDTGAVFGGALTAGIFTEEHGCPVGFLHASCSCG
jgi:serine/threonine protein phosphatase 1